MSDTATYAAWVDQAHAWGGVATAWPFSTGDYASYYGQPAARFPMDTFLAMVDDGRVDASTAIAQMNNAQTWVYLLASSMTGNTNIVTAAQGLVNPSQAELEQACAVNNDCPVDWSALVKEIVIGIAILAGVAVFTRIG
jgi:hypothetical protein